MKDVKVSKAELIKILTENRAKHQAIFLEAVEGYRQQMDKELQNKLHEIRKGKGIVRLVQMQIPVDHTKDYDRVIRMLTLSLDDQIMLSEADMQQYVMDDWAWKRDFLYSNMAYSKTASDTLLAVDNADSN